jgi:hypothetical protein
MFRTIDNFLPSISTNYLALIQEHWFSEVVVCALLGMQGCNGLIRRSLARVMSHFLDCLRWLGFPDPSASWQCISPDRYQRVTGVRHVDLGHETAAAH